AARRAIGPAAPTADRARLEPYSPVAGTARPRRLPGHVVHGRHSSSTPARGDVRGPRHRRAAARGRAVTQPRDRVSPWFQRAAELVAVVAIAFGLHLVYGPLLWI